MYHGLVDYNKEIVFESALQTLCTESCPCDVRNETLKEKISSTNKILNLTTKFEKKGKNYTFNASSCS